MLRNRTRLLTELRLSNSARFLFCIAVIALATLFRWLLNPSLGTDLPYITMYFAVMLVAFVGGLGPAILGVALGILATVFFITPLQSRATGIHDIILSILFACFGVATGVMSGAYRRALKAAEDAYEVSRQQKTELQQIYAAAPVGLALLDEKLRYVRVDDALAALNGLPSEAHIGRHISEILSPETTRLLEPLLQQVLSTGKPIVNMEIEGSTISMGDQVLYVRESLYPVQLGELRGIYAVVQDFTAEKKAKDELKVAENQLRHAGKMEAVGRLAGGVAHDFNNLLMVISSYTELLLEQLQDQPDKAKKLNAISGATQRAARLTKQLLAFSRRQTMQPQVLEVDPLVRNFEPLLQRVISEEIELILELRSEGARVKVDPSQLEQVLMNLALNSRDAMTKDGRLAIHTTVSRFEDEGVRSVFTIPRGEYVEISVTDSGCGMSPEVQARIFDPFFTTKERGQGTGLGLAMVYGIVKQSEGYIEVQSAMAQGTTFRIWLPITREVTAAPAVQASRAPSATGTILVVEDETMLRQAICESLMNQGYRVLEAADGVQALAVIESQANHIDLVVSDAVMPNMGGMDLLQRIGAQYPSIKVLLMSGYTNASSLGAESFQHGKPDDGLVILQKPFAHSELAQIIRKILRSSLPV